MHGGLQTFRVSRGALVIAFLMAAFAYATPPVYQGFHRDQVIGYIPDEASLLRIWVAYIGQGDAILIQFPKKFASASGEPVEMLVDGGPGGNQLLAFLKALYPAPATTIEHVVLTHHDADHVDGLSTLIENGAFRITNLYHNGLASWKLGSHLFPGSHWPAASEAVVDRNIGRGMAGYNGRPVFRDDAIVTDKAQLISGLEDYGVVYDRLAAAVKKAAVESFPRAHIDSTDFPSAVGDIRLIPLWPSVAARGYGGEPGTSPDWSHSINGNSVVFRLEYGKFSMLFTGDLNEDSETDLMATLDKAHRLDSLHTDVLKIPHHGSGHGIEAFFREVHPVVSVASMGGKGFGTTWKHPSTEVIKWLGGTSRVYHTYIHERVFNYADLSAAKRKAMTETKHVLIETDGQRFRIVEVEDPKNPIPGVEDVKRGDGSRWIDAAESPGG